MIKEKKTQLIRNLMRSYTDFRDLLDADQLPPKEAAFIRRLALDCAHVNDES